MREKILDMLEKNRRIDLKEMAIMLGYSAAEVANEIANMEKEQTTKYKYLKMLYQQL